MRTVDESQEKVRSSTGKLPIWYSGGIAVALFVVFAVGDVHLPPIAVLGLVAVYFVVITALLVALKRSRVRPHRTDYQPARLVGGAILLGAVLAIVVAVSEPLLRSAGVALAGTMTGLLTALVFMLLVFLVLPRLDRWARRDQA
ncbi:hypothetical protein GCM10009765_17670 [Fodinicola feengrottensis]|uniref:Uncharacterized protein n=2 Tax=Fodinicola feengrottensis TaxID=435914 RepID=A0ABP4S7P6_9ACTN